MGNRRIRRSRHPLWLAIVCCLLASSCGASSTVDGPVEIDQLTQHDRDGLDNARDAFLVTCMAAAGFDATPAEIASGQVPSRFDGEQFLLRLNGGPETLAIPPGADGAARIADMVRNGSYPPDHSCSSIADAAAAIQVLGIERAELALGSAGSPGPGALTTLLVDPDVVAADQVWRACLAARGIDTADYRLVDDLDSEIEEIEAFLETTDPAVRASDDYISAKGRLPVLVSGAAVCNPPMTATLRARAEALGLA